MRKIKLKTLSKREKTIHKFKELLRKYEENPEWVDKDVYLFTEQEVIFIYEFLIKLKYKVRK